MTAQQKFNQRMNNRKRSQIVKAKLGFGKVTKGNEMKNVSLLTKLPAIDKKLHGKVLNARNMCAIILLALEMRENGITHKDVLNDPKTV